jgi:DNA polymerase-4
MMDFNSAPSSIMHIDLNSCFASIEQQANPLLRGKPIAVAAYNSPAGCILASSREAKVLGIKTGFRVKDAKKLCPTLIVLTPDPDKYRFVHLGLREILKDYTNNFYPKSIDEFVLDFTGYPAFGRGLFNVAKEIKVRIKKEIGDFLTVSIGISTNRILAKLASNLHKPDGLDEINKENFLSIYKNLSLTDLCGINFRNEARLRSVGINSVIDFYHADRMLLRAAFKSVLADYWYSRLRGWEIDDVEFSRRSFGNSYALPFRSLGEGGRDLFPILQNLVEKTGARLRSAGFKARGIGVQILFRDRTFWQKSKLLGKEIFDSRDIYKEARQILSSCPYQKPVHTLSESCFELVSLNSLQLEVFEDVAKKERLTKAIDKVNKRFGDFVVTPARMILVGSTIQDRIAFGGVKEL